jgi:hypothetical protein
MHFTVRWPVECVAPMPASKSNSHLGAEVHADGREELLLLLAQRIKTPQRSVAVAVLQPARNLFGDVVAEFHVWRKRHPPDSRLGRETIGPRRD